MKTRIIIIGILTVILLQTGAKADGCFVPPPNVQIYEPDQRALIMKDGDYESIILQVRAEGSAQEFGWVVPVPSYPNVTEADSLIFNDLERLTAPRSVHFRMPSFAMGEGKAMDYAGVYVETEEVGIYEINTIQAYDPRGLYNWLNDNGYRLPWQAGRILDDYIKRHFCFIAISVLPEYRDDPNGYPPPPPYEPYPPRHPYEEYGSDDSSGRWGSGDSSSESGSPDYNNSPKSRWKHSKDSDQSYSSYEPYYGDRTDPVEPYPPYPRKPYHFANWLPPLRIDFQSKKCFFPMKISSLNPGSTRLTIWTVSPHGMTLQGARRTWNQKVSYDRLMREGYYSLADLVRGNYYISRFEKNWQDNTRIKGDLYLADSFYF